MLFGWSAFGQDKDKDKDAKDKVEAKDKADKDKADKDKADKDKADKDKADKDKAEPKTVDKDAVPLKWKFEKGKKFYQEMTTETTQAMKIMQMDVNQKQ